MKVSRSWLQTYVDISAASDDDISRAITFLGFEVEQVIKTGAPALELVVVGEILTRDKHPNADKLSICTVDVGETHGGVRTIVCGAHNCDVGNRVPVALPGATLPGNFTIKEAKVRGQASSGMLCAATELSLAESSDGLFILSGQPAVGTPINAVLPPGDVVFDIEITPNRPDCLSHIGIARELAAWFRKDLAYPEVGFTPASVDSDPHSELLKSVRVEAGEECPLYTATVISGVKVGPSPDWLQQRLTAIGLRPVNNVVDIGNFVLLEYGQPVHAFDARRLAGHEIIVRQAAEGEKLKTLDGKERALTLGNLVIADAEKPVVIAGIMGGEDSGVSAGTTDLVLEVAIFDRRSVRRTARQHGLSSDSSYRYERGVDPHTLDEAMHRCIDLILEIAGGKVAGPIRKVGGDIPWEREITVTPGYINEKLGFDIPAEDMRSAFEALELTIVREEPTESRGPAWTLSIPTWRDDLDRPIDLVEEVLRVYGTEKIPVTTVTAPGLVTTDDPIVCFNRTVSAHLVGQSFNECVNYTLRSGEELNSWASAESVATFGLANPFVEDQSHLRSSLIGGLLDSLKLNQSRDVDASRFFETGRVFAESEGVLTECVAVGFIFAEETGERAWRNREPADFYTAKRHVETLASAAGIDFGRQPLTPVTDTAGAWQAGHAATAGQIRYGWSASFGLVSLALTKQLGLTGRIYAGIVQVLPEKLGSVGAGARKRYQPLNLMPAALRDLALIVDVSTTAAEVQKSLTKIARAAVDKTFALEGVQIFDVYQGKGLPEDKKSLGFSLIFRAPDRTLTDAEVNGVFTKIQDELGTKTAYQIRK